MGEEPAGRQFCSRASVGAQVEEVRGRRPDNEPKLHQVELAVSGAARTISGRLYLIVSVPFIPACAWPGTEQ